MNAAISTWFKTQDYDEGVALYRQLPKQDPRTLKSLQRGKSDRNMAMLMRELRKNRDSKKNPVPDPKSTPRVKPVSVRKSIGGHQEQERKAIVEKSVANESKRARYGELPSVLKLRFRELKEIFYDMSDLKFSLNDLPAKDEKKALKVQLQIAALDEHRMQIWKEIDHWTDFKTLLPNNASEDFSKLTPQQLFLKKANLASSISKIQKRISEREQKISKEVDKEKCQRLMEQNNRSRKKLHQHELNLSKITELL